MTDDKHANHGFNYDGRSIEVGAQDGIERISDPVTHFREMVKAAGQAPDTTLGGRQSRRLPLVSDLRLSDVGGGSNEPLSGHAEQITARRSQSDQEPGLG